MRATATTHDFDEIERAARDAESVVVEPVLRMH